MEKSRFPFPMSPKTSYTRFVALGRMLMRGMLAQVLADPRLNNALASDVNQRMSGPQNYFLRSKTRFLKRMLRAWLWAQGNHLNRNSERSAKPNVAANEADAYSHTLHTNPTPKRPKSPIRRHAIAARAPLFTKLPAPISACAEEETPETKEAAEIRQGKDKNALLHALKAQGFAPRVRLWTLPRPRKPAALPPTAQAVQMLPEAQNWLFGRSNVFPLNTATEAEAESDTQDTKANTPRNFTPKAGQIYIDLKKIEALLDAPDRAVNKVSRRIKRLPANPHAPITYPRPKPLPCPKPPSESWMGKLDADEKMTRWWADLTPDAADGSDPATSQPSNPPHPPPERELEEDAIEKDTNTDTLHVAPDLGWQVKRASPGGGRRASQLRCDETSTHNQRPKPPPEMVSPLIKPAAIALTG